MVYASLRYIERKSTIEGTTKPRGGYRHLPFTVTVYLFLAILRSIHSKLPKKGIPVDFTPVYGTLNENQLLAQQSQEDTDIPFAVTVYLFLAKNTMLLFKTAERYIGGFSASLRFIERNSAIEGCLLYTSPSPRDGLLSRMPSSA